jgi:SAM-dependent methyltransferase
MASTVPLHYEKHLGPIYSWMVGDFDVAAGAMSRYFDELGIPAQACGRAIDLGCGHGIQTLPLARRGFQVTAVDSCQQLLDELQVRAAGYAVTTVKDDILDYTCNLLEPVELIVCMGDTLTHLDSRDDVARLVHGACRALTGDGVLCFSFRDYSRGELRGDARIIPVRSDEQRIHLCFLEYEATAVRVHDIIQTRTADGWDVSVGSYLKLRLAPDDVEAMAGESGLDCFHREDHRGMRYLAFRPVRPGQRPTIS